MFAAYDFPEAPLKKLVILWDYHVEAATFDVQLAAPKNKEGEELWRISVPAPAEWINVSERLDSTNEDILIKKKAEKSQGEQ